MYAHVRTRSCLAPARKRLFVFMYLQYADGNLACWVAVATICLQIQSVLTFLWPAGWWQDGKPWEVLMALVCVLFGLSGIRRAPASIPRHSGME